MDKQTADFLNSVKTKSMNDLFVDSYFAGNYSAYRRKGCHKTINTKEINIYFDEQNFKKYITSVYSHWLGYIEKNKDNFSDKQKELLNKMLPLPSPRDVDKVLDFFDKFGTDYTGEPSNKMLPISFQSARPTDGGFVRVYLPSTRDRYNSTHQKIDCRLYLNLKAQNTSRFAIEFYKKAVQAKFPVHYKFTIQDFDHDDNFLAYLPYDKVPECIKIFEQIKAEHPELFVGTEKVAKALGCVNGYIGFGEEPYQTGKESYNSIRKKVINEVIEKANKNTYKFLDNACKLSVVKANFKEQANNDKKLNAIKAFVNKTVYEQVKAQYKDMSDAEAKDCAEKYTIFYVNHILNGARQMSIYHAFPRKNSYDLNFIDINKEICTHFGLSTNLSDLQLRAIIMKTCLFPKAQTQEERNSFTMFVNGLIFSTNYFIKNNQSLSEQKKKELVDYVKALQSPVGNTLAGLQIAFYNFITTDPSQINTLGKFQIASKGVSFTYTVNDIFMKYVDIDYAKNLLKDLCNENGICYERMDLNPDTYKELCEFNRNAQANEQPQSQSQE